MKKYLLVLFALVLSFSLTSCGEINDIKQIVENKVSEKVSEKEAEKTSEGIEATEEEGSIEDSSAKEEESSSESINSTSATESVTEESTAAEEPEKKVEDFIVLRDVNEIDGLKDYNWKVVESSHLDPYTGENKEVYIVENNPDFELRMPLILSNDEEAERINQEILKYYENLNLSKVKSVFIDYDANIKNDILSLRIMSEMVMLNGVVYPFQTQYGVNFDISSGEAVYLSSGEMLSRLGVEASVIEAFISDLIPEIYNGFNPLYENDEVDLEEEISEFIDNFRFGLSLDLLCIWKNPYNDYYSMELSREIRSKNGYKYYYNIPLADSQFKMAMLTRPRNALGVIYKATEDEIMPSMSIYGSNVVLNELDDGEGQAVYVASFGEDGNFGYYDLEYKIIELSNDEVLFAPRITQKEYNTDIDNNVFNIYKFHTVLPETIPWEAISVKSEIDGEMYVGLDEIYDDMRFGSKIQYIYPSTHLGNYEKEVSGNLGRIKFMDGWDFEVVDEDSWMEDSGFYARKGKYTSDSMYYYLYPCKEDLENGASELIVFKKEKRDKISFYYDSSLGLIKDSFKLAFEK